MSETKAQTKTKSTAKAKTRDIRAEIIAQYQEQLLMEGHAPASVYAFCKSLKIEESEFYQHFSGFAQIAAAFWQSQLQHTISRLEQTPEFAEFSVREKLLSFYFGFFEGLKNQRSYALLSLEAKHKSLQSNPELEHLKKDYQEWVKRLMAEGRSREEIAGRSRFNELYDRLFWMQFLFLLDFWRKDSSPAFERTDEAIEKGVNFSFDLIEKNALDSAFDFGKFWFQNR